MPGKDFYKILGVPKSATADEVKAAFRKLAHQYHPDKPGGDEAKFKEANEAYQVLGDPEKRRKYDQFGSAAFDPSTSSGQGGFGGFSGMGGFEDLGDLFGEMFGFSARGGSAFGGGNTKTRRTHRGADIHVDVDLSFKEAVFGATKNLTLTRNGRCDRCGGVGAEPGAGMRTCEDCGGEGVKTQTTRTILGAMRTRVTCQSCDGRGEVPKTICTACHGTGLKRDRKTLSVNIPAGVDDGVLVRVRGEGEGERGGESGDLILHIHVAPDERFERQGDTIYSTVKIGFTQAALGDSVEHETVDGSVSIKIPAGTQSGTELRLKGKGVPIRGGSAFAKASADRRGDHIVRIEVITPKKLTREQKRLMENLDLSE